jgi:hypothetical protein
MEQMHQKTFCKICLAGRTVFIREQRIYHTQKLRQHIEHGDPGGEKGAEILPHPWCDFCQQFYYNDQIFLDHLQRLHLTCHLCDDFYKSYYYSDYPSLEKHFNQSHYLCPYEDCKNKCYVAFQSQNELKAHTEMVHTARGNKVASHNVNSWLNFKDDDEDSGVGRRPKVQKPRNELKDKEGVDFSFFFSQKY